MKSMIKRFVAASALSAAATVAGAETQGVTDDEIIIGDIVKSAQAVLLCDNYCERELLTAQPTSP